MSEPGTNHNIDVDNPDTEAVDRGPRYFCTVPAACLKRRYRAIPQDSLEKIKKRLVIGYKELEVPENSNKENMEKTPNKETEKSKV